VVVGWVSRPRAEPVVRALVAELAGTDPGPLHHSCPRCGSVEHGRPVVDASVELSISRAPGLTAVAVSTAGPVGIDVAPAGAAGLVVREAIGKALGVGLMLDDLPEPTRLQPLTLPGHAGALAVVSPEAREAAEAAVRTTRPRRAPRGPGRTPHRPA
jgi:hypothetical protein